MTTFVSKEEYEPVIISYRLDAVTQQDDDLIDAAEKRAIAFIKSYLSGRFDADAAFAATGDNRNMWLVQMVLDISLYELYRRIAPRKIPEYLQDLYTQHKEWLNGVLSGDINPPGLPLYADQSHKQIIYGSNPKRDNHV